MFNQKVLELANHIGRKKMGSKNQILVTDPEYRILEPVVTTAMAEVALCMQIRQKTNAKELAPKCNKSVEETEKLLWELADAGVCFVNNIDGVDTYWYDTWVPGIMEMMTNNKTNVEKYPQIAEAFEAYGRVRGPKTAGAFPVGVGLMRVIPIETAIDGETRRASYEEVSKYLNDNDIFSVSDCSCRVTRRVMGEGCGHLAEEMCIQMGHAAEYYIRTGRGREITREEAFEIIKKAEENGLMHQIPNLDGSGKTHAICNCCGCSCLSLRTASVFKNVDMVRSNYVSKVDKDKCVACGECVKTCPVNALQLGQKLCYVTPPQKKALETPRDMEWGPDKWNLDYRINRKDVTDTGTSPCKTECPAHISIQGYIKLAAQGRYKEALELIKHDNPFPAVCGRICPKKCESACTRGDIDTPVAIDDIKKYIAEQDLVDQNRYIPSKRHEYGKKIAVIGAGPAGLSCAFFLAIDGYKVTVFEKEKALGGMLTLGIPSFRLEKDVVNAEIEVLRELSVDFKTNTEVGKDISLKELRQQGYEAFYLAIGAQAGRKLGIEGEDGAGIQYGVDFLRNVNLHNMIDTNTKSNVKQDCNLTSNGYTVSGKVVVIGGGNVAIDVARTAIRTGAKNTKMFCLESREQMPALLEEVEEALQEDIEICNSYGPKRFILENGRVKGVEFKKCISTLDSNGRFQPIYDEADTIIVEADHVLISVGQTYDYGTLLLESGLQCNPNGTLAADTVTYQTSVKDIFTGGDVHTGPRFAIDAIAAGKQAAISIHRFVQPGQSLVLGRDRREYHSLDKQNIEIDGYDHMPRQRTNHVHGNHSKTTFKDLRGTFTREQIEHETKRCLSCGATEVDSYLCVGCGACTTQCKFDAISLVREYDGQGVLFEDLKPVVIKQMLKRKGKIAIKKASKLFIKK
ncbi:MAG: FAD-dependent oxidoreductase [Anaerocolumna sp.]